MDNEIHELSDYYVDHGDCWETFRGTVESIEHFLFNTVELPFTPGFELALPDGGRVILWRTATYFHISVEDKDGKRLADSPHWPISMLSRKVRNCQRLPGNPSELVNGID